MDWIGLDWDWDYIYVFVWFGRVMGCAVMVVRACVHNEKFLGG